MAGGALARPGPTTGVERGQDALFLARRPAHNVARLLDVRNALRTAPRKQAHMHVGFCTHCAKPIQQGPRPPVVRPAEVHVVELPKKSAQPGMISRSKGRAHVPSARLRHG
eukprot:1404672-Pyramimonas_sp.AAC.1